MTPAEGYRPTVILQKRLLAGLVALLPFSVFADTHYVNPQSSMPTPPFTNWSTAAQNIQTAICAAVTGDVVLVTNGLYDTGGVAVFGTMTNRVALTNSVTVRSVKGPAWTTIAGTGPVGATAVRCAYVGPSSVLDGFTLINGATLTGGDVDKEQSGGGVWCMPGGQVSNCRIEGCSGNENGGGSYAGTLVSCRLTGNSVIRGGSGGGAYGASLSGCTLSGNHAYRGGGAYGSSLHGCELVGNSADSFGGGVSDCTLDRCTVVSNSAAVDGGGAYASQLYNCVLVGNSATNDGGGAAYGTLNSCTLSGNSAGARAGGMFVSELTNCIVYYNSAPLNANYKWGALAYSCSDPLPSGPGNITGDPEFADSNRWINLRLILKSGCVNTGTNLAWMAGAADLDGTPRIINGNVDMGAYEFQIDGCMILIH